VDLFAAVSSPARAGGDVGGLMLLAVYHYRGEANNDRVWECRRCAEINLYPRFVDVLALRNHQRDKAGHADATSKDA
jgi:hypothetical protein